MKKLTSKKAIVNAIQSSFSKTGNMRVFPQEEEKIAFKKNANKTNATIDKEAIDKETGFDKTASIQKTANFEMGNVNTMFYSPRLTPDTWYLPRSRKMLLKWVDIFFDWDPYIYSILMMHSRYPIGNFNLICEEKEEQFFNEVLHNEQWDILDVLREGSISFTKFGEAICLTGDTEIKLLDGTTKTIKELYENKAENFYVYSLDKDLNIVAGKADKVVLTKKNAEILKVTLDNGQSFKCTPNHLIMMRDGSYKEAKDLKENESVMPLYFNKHHVHCGEKKSKHRYESVYVPRTGKYEFTHRIIASNNTEIEKGFVVHHKNRNQFDNTPDNLQIMSLQEHGKLHGNSYTDEQIKHYSNKTKELWQNEEYREKVLKAKESALNKPGAMDRIKKIISKKSKQNWANPEFRAKQKNRPSHIPTKEEKIAISKRMKQYVAEHREEVLAKIKKATAIAAIKNTGRKKTEEAKRKQSEAAKKFYQSPYGRYLQSVRSAKRWGNPIEPYVYQNHKIAKIEKVANEDVYDIHSVDKYHNFALACGVFVHNCIGDWDSELGIWKGFSWIDPGLIEVKEIPFTGKIKIFLEIPSKYKRAINGKSAADEIERELIPDYIKEAVKKGLKYIELDNEETTDEQGRYSPPKVCMMVNKTNVGEKGLRGLPPMTPAIKTLVYSDYLRKAQMARAQRFAYPIEIWRFGDIQNGYIPNDEELSSVREMLQKALTNPPYTIVYTPLLSLEVVSPAGGLLPIYDDYNFVENQVLVALGTNKNIVLGEGGWMSNAKTLSMQRLIMDYQIVRDMWTRTFLQNFVLRPMCIANGFTKKSLVDKTKDIANVPKIAWVNSLDVQNEEDQKKLYIDLWDKGLISSKTLYSQFPDLDFKTETTQMQEEKGTVLDGTGRTLPATVKEIENEEKETEVKTSADEVNEKPIKPIKMDI